MALFDDLDVPMWVPGAVRDMASVMPVGHIIAKAMLKDPRMERVWKTLQSRNITEAAISAVPSNQRLETWGLDSYAVSLQDKACAAFLAHVVIELGVEKEPMTKKLLDERLQPWRISAKHCRDVLSQQAWHALNSELAKSLTASTEYFESMIRFIESTNEKSPYYLKKSSEDRGDNGVRTKTRAIAAGTRRIFGEYLYGTVATVASVSLALEQDLTREKVIDWCKGMAVPSSSNH